MGSTTDMKQGRYSGNIDNRCKHVINSLLYNNLIILTISISIVATVVSLLLDV